MAQERTDIEQIDRTDPDIDSAGSTSGRSTDDDGLADTIGESLSHNVDTDDSDGEDQNSETDDIMDRIEDTRSQMGETIDAIQDRLSFSNISEQVSDHVQNAVETAKDAVYEATIGKAREIMRNISNGMANSSAVRTVKDNPLPFILIGAGAGLLAYKAYAGGLSASGRRSSTNRSSRQLTDGSSSGTTNGVTEKVSSAAGSAVSAVSGAMDSAYTAAGDVVNRAYDKVDSLKGAAREQYDTYLNENPLVLGAAALVVGAAVGMAIPASRYENELMGETRENLLGMAQEKVSGLIDDTRNAISEATRTDDVQTGSAAAH